MSDEETKRAVAVVVDTVAATTAEIEIELTVTHVTEARAECRRCNTIWTARSNTLPFGKTPEEDVLAEAREHRCIPVDLELRQRDRGLRPA